MEAKALSVIKKPNWPKPIKLIGQGNFGNVFNTNNGRVLKLFTSEEGRNPRTEFNLLMKLQNAKFVPFVKNGNYTNIQKNNKNFQNYISMYHPNRTGRAGGAFLMEKINKPGMMTLRTYLQRFPDLKDRVYRVLRKKIMYLIRKGIVHGDLENNIIITANQKGQITGMWLIDFGSGRYIQSNNGNKFNNLAQIKLLIYPYSQNNNKNVADEAYDLLNNSQYIQQLTKNLQRLRGATS